MSQAGAGICRRDSHHESASWEAMPAILGWSGWGMMSRKGTAAPDVGAVGSPVWTKPDCLGGIAAAAMIAMPTICSLASWWPDVFFGIEMLETNVDVRISISHSRNLSTIPTRPLSWGDSLRYRSPLHHQRDSYRSPIRHFTSRQSVYQRPSVSMQNQRLRPDPTVRH